MKASGPPRFQDLRKAADAAGELATRATRARSEFCGEAFARAFRAIEGLFEEAGLKLEVTESGATWSPLQQVPQ